MGSRVWRQVRRPDRPRRNHLRRLNETARGLTLNAIGLGTIKRGGYLISHTPKAPPAPYRLLLGPSVQDCIDVTGRPSADLLDVPKLVELLKLIQKLGKWGQMLSVKLLVVLDGQPVSESLPQVLNCPVQPHNGRMLPLDLTGNGSKLTYQGDPDRNGFSGRLLHKIEGFDGYFFKYAGKFETSASRRGFDCITYVGTTSGAPDDAMTASPQLADAMNAKRCSIERLVSQDSPTGQTPPTAAPRTKKVTLELEQTDPQNVKDFFASKPTGYYLMWSGGHIVIVADGSVYEFAASRKGYVATPVSSWLEPYRTKRLTVRELPSKPALAT